MAKIDPLKMAGLIAGVVIGAGAFVYLNHSSGDAGSAEAATASAPSITKAPTTYTAVLTCRTGDHTPVLVQGCLQGRNAILKINDGSDVREYSGEDIMRFTDNEQRFKLNRGYRVEAFVSEETYFVLRVEIRDSSGQRVFADEATRGEPIVAQG